MNKASLLELAKKMNIPRRNCMKTEEEFEKVIKDTITRYKDIIFGPDTPGCMACLEKPRKQHIDQKLYDQRLMDDTLRKHAWKGLQENIVIDGDTMTDKGKGKVLGPEVDSMYWKDKF